MEENTEQQKQVPAPKRGMNDFRKALLCTAIPIVVLSLVGMVGMSSDVVELLALSWWAAVLFFLGAFIVLIVYAAERKDQAAAGILAGLGIGLVSLGTTCFAGNALSGGIFF